MPAWHSSSQAAEKALHLCSQLIKILNVARGYASGFVSPAAAVAGFLSNLHRQAEPAAVVSRIAQIP
jgi:histidine ammonia-lyase